MTDERATRCRCENAVLLLLLLRSSLDAQLVSERKREQRPPEADGQLVGKGGSLTIKHGQPPRASTCILVFLYQAQHVVLNLVGTPSLHITRYIVVSPLAAKLQHWTPSHSFPDHTIMTR